MAALLDSVRRGELDRFEIPENPLDVLAQQIVAEVAAREWHEDELLALLRRAWPYRNLTRADFEAVVLMLAEGFSTKRGRRGALLHHDAVNGILRGRRGARLTALTSGGVILENADYRVLLEPNNLFIGSVHEDFAVESLAGDIFQLGNQSYRILPHQLHRTLGITYRSAWFMSHRIREAMRAGGLAPIGGPGGIVEVDETFIGRVEGVPKQKSGSTPLSSAAARLAASTSIAHAAQTLKASYAPTSARSRA